jgi:hypothetical protein
VPPPAPGIIAAGRLSFCAAGETSGWSSLQGRWTRAGCIGSEGIVIFPSNESDAVTGVATKMRQARNLKPTAPLRPTKSSEAEPHSFPRFWVCVLLAGMGLAIGYQVLSGFIGRSSTGPARAGADMAKGADELIGVPVEATNAPVREVTVKQTSVAPRVRSAAPGPVQTPPTVPASSAYAQQLIAQLTQAKLGGAVMTAEQAQQLRQNVNELTQQGAAAVPAIREFLDKNQDLSFGEGSARLVGYPSLRVGLLESLRQIGGPDAVEVSRQVLQTTADPLELAVLARNLEEAAPGQYREDALNAARETLAQIAEGKLAVKEVALLFQVLQTYGDPSVAADLQKALPQYGYYATMALAGMPSGDGIPSLIQLAQDSAGTGTSQAKFVLQMMAQMSVQYPDAGAALVELARQHQVPESAWGLIAQGLAGDQYQFTRQLPDDTFPIVGGPGVKTYHIESGNQNFFSTAFPENWSPTEIDQRRALIDQLLAVNSSPVAVDALQKARGWLAGNKAGR